MIPSYRHVKYGIIIENVSNEVGSMKKFIMGLIVGLCIGLPISTMADSMIGKRIETEVPIKLDGEYLPINAIGLEGRTYAPVRALAEALGKEVDWDGEVIIKSPDKLEESKQGGDRQVNEQQDNEEVNNRIEMLKSLIDGNKGAIEIYKETIKMNERIGTPKEANENLERTIKQLEEEIERYQQELAELEKSE